MGYGQGTLRQKDNGKWQARYWGPDARQHSKTFDRKTDAKACLDDAKVDRRRGSWIDPGKAQTRFDQWANEWFKGKHDLAPSAWARDESVIRNHILPTFGRRPLGQIGPLEVRAWVNELVAKGLSPRSVHRAYGIFGAIMRSAVAARLIAEAPVGRGVATLPKIERKRERFLNEQQVEALALEFPPFYRPLIYAAAYTGCRWQELAGLKRRNLDLKERVLHVRTVAARGVKGVKECPKSDAGRRSIRLPARLVEVLTFHLAAAPRSEFVFPAREGGMLSESNFRRLWSGTKRNGYEGAVVRAGLDPLTFHDLRHTHVAWLIDASIQPLTIQRRLGHKDIGTTMNVYGHLFPNAEDALVDDLDRRWSSAKLREDEPRGGAGTA